MSETPAPASATAEPADLANPESFPVRLFYGVVGALTADLGCVIGAIAFLVLIAASAIFATAITPCTSAGGIPCAP